MEIQIIVAMTRDRIIGKDGKIPWSIPQDLNLFKRLTSNNTVIMGKNTWLSIPMRFRPLPDRVNIAVSGTLENADGAILCKDINEAMKRAEEQNGKVFCIGGAQLYTAMLPLAKTLHISWVKEIYSGDAHFPEVDFKEWKEVEAKEFKEFTYKKYVRA